VLKKSIFVLYSQNLGDRKCLGDPRKSIVGLPDAILFLSMLRQGVFQQPPWVLKKYVSGTAFSAASAAAKFFFSLFG
jgi:hypothetical protein